MKVFEWTRSLISGRATVSKCLIAKVTTSLKELLDNAKLMLESYRGYILSFASEL
jgi:hypothetical protein